MQVIKNLSAIRAYRSTECSVAKYGVLIIVIFLSILNGSTVFGQYGKKPIINCEGSCAIPSTMDTLLIFPPKINIETIDFFGNPTYNWKATGQAKDSLKQALLEYFYDSVTVDKKGVKTMRNTVGLKFPEFDSLQGKMINDSIRTISYHVNKRKADTTMHVPENYYWMLGNKQERYGLIMKINGYVKEDKVFWTQLVTDLIFPLDPGHQDVYRTDFRCYIIDLEKREIVYTGWYIQVLPANYKVVMEHFLNAFFNDYLKK